MKRGRIENILEVLADGACSAAHLFVAIHEAGYGASQRQIERKLSKIENRKLFASQPKGSNREKHNLYSLLGYMRKDGLIEKRAEKWNITRSGKERLKNPRFRFPDRKYKAEASDSLKIVMFDIPEKERGKRVWLRSKLIELDFKLLQKSVWAGRKKLPKEFLEDLEKRNMLGYIDIFTVTKSGSLRNFKISG